MGYNVPIIIQGWRQSMRCFKKTLSVAVALLMVLTGVFPAMQEAFAAEYILDASQLRGRDYTNSQALAEVLEQVFAGDVDIYSDEYYTQEVSMGIGTVMNNDTLYHVRSQTTGNRVSGWQCYIYGNAVYNKLFREWVGHANGFSHSSVVVSGGANTISESLLRNSGVRCGAYVRTTANADGSYHRSSGHSMIILGYDSRGITILEGNADGKGLIRVTVQTWDEFNERQLSGRGRYIAHIVQPKDDVYQTLYPSCEHFVFNQDGACMACGYTYDWEATCNPWTAGLYRVTVTVAPRVELPYSSAPAAPDQLNPGQTVRVLGRYENAHGQLWYSYANSAGTICYVNSDALELVSYLPFEVTCVDFLPADGAQLEPKAQPVKGTVTANYPLKTIVGLLDGQQYAAWTAADETTAQVNLQQTDINRKLSFATLAPGKHTVTLMAQSQVHGQLVVIHESSFYIISPEPCTHSYTSQVTQEPTCTGEGVLTYTCSLCADSYTRPLAALGHDYREGVCTFCGDRLPLAVLKGTVISGGSTQDPVTVTLRGEKTWSASVLGTSYSITGITPGTYTLEASKNGCVTLTRELVLEVGDTTCDLKLCPLGDVTGDRVVNVGDTGRLYAHARNTGKLQDPYTLLCADCTGDGRVNVGDVSMLYGWIRNTKK